MLHTVANDPELATTVGEAKKRKSAALLNDVRDFIRRFCVFPDEHALTAVTLWAAHAHMIAHFHTSPRLLMSSAEAGSGKTRVLEVLDLLVPEPMLSLNASPATIFRTLLKRQITLLFDEVDVIWNTRATDENRENLRALLNSGYKRGATIPRCVGPKHDIVNFPVFAAVALAGLGELPDTIMTRAVIIRMRRRAPAERVEPFRTRVHEGLGHALRIRLSAWAEEVGCLVGNAWPTLPDGIVDRPAELWEPLLAVADAAGGEWPTASREACLSLCQSALDRRVSLGIRLLSDLRLVFGESIAMHTETILNRLCDGETFGLAADAPWADLYGKRISVRKLASMLGDHGVRSLKVKVGGQSLQGYRREHLWDVWQRYLPCTPSAEPVLVEPLEIVKPSQPRPGTLKHPEVPEVPEVPALQGNGGLESRIRAMAERWDYSTDELAEALAGAAADPESWRRTVDHDEFKSGK
jgi:hypothetical protein